MKKFLNAHQYYIHNLIAPGMKIPTDNQKEEAIIKAFKEEMKELKKDIKMEEPFVYGMEKKIVEDNFYGGTENSNSNGAFIKNEPNNDFDYDENNYALIGGEGQNYAVSDSQNYAADHLLAEMPPAKKPKLNKKPPPPLIKIENLPSDSESEEETESPFVNDAVDVNDDNRNDDNGTADEVDDDNDISDDEYGEVVEDQDPELVSVEPQYEFGDEESDDDEDSENGGAHGGFLEPFIQIEEDKHHS